MMPSEMMLKDYFNIPNEPPVEVEEEIYIEDED
jgi:hypothetical protein